VSSDSSGTSTDQAPEKSIVDENLFKVFGLYLTERTRLSSTKYEQSKAFDQTILTYSVGAIGLSITFLEKVVKTTSATGWLYASWILFAMAMLCTLYSLLTAQRAFEVEIAAFDAKFNGIVGLPAQETSSSASPMTIWGVSLRWLIAVVSIFSVTSSWYAQVVKWLNRLAAGFFFFGVMTFALFARLNWMPLQRGTTTVTEQRTRTSTPPPHNVQKLPGGLKPDAGVLPPISPSKPSPQPPSPPTSKDKP